MQWKEENIKKLYWVWTKDSVIGLTVCGLGKFLVGNHLILEADQEFFHGIFCLPLSKDTELSWLYLSVVGVHTWNVHLWEETHIWVLGRIVGAAFDCQEIDTIIKVSVGRSDDCSIPLSKGSVITYAKILDSLLGLTLSKSVGDGLIT